MSFLLDSHALLWALHAPGKLRPQALAVIRDRRHAVFFSAASAWELEMKASRGKLSLPQDWLVAADEAGFLHLPITAADGVASARLPWHHADPFDRVLVAQAQAHGLTMVTRDRLIAPYDVKLIEA